ncbi:MAG: HIT domain-containing protein [Azospirillum sp.]|nr:HIT domain-containing protein [Azospirillum sp.]
MIYLHERLAADTVTIGRLQLSRLLLVDNRLWRWLILVPVRPEVTEIYQLSPDDRSLLIEEIAAVSQAMTSLFAPHKLNIGALGNLVPQLHIHVVARYRDDPAWPNPVWGAGLSERYSSEALTDLRLRLGKYLGAQTVDDS